MNRPPEYWRNRAVVLKAANHWCAIQLEGHCTGKATQTDHIIPVWQGIIERLAPTPKHPDGYTITWADQSAGIKLDDVANLSAA